MMLNPELRRYMWLELSRHRLLAVPLLIVAFIVLALTTDNPARYVFSGAISVFIIMVSVIGSVRAYGSVTEEVRDRTWDFQRMSALKPWSLALGKIFGSTVFCWYVGLWVLLVAAVAGIANSTPQLGSSLLIMVASAVMLHGLGVAASAATAQLGLSPRMRRGGAAIGLISLVYLGAGIGALFVTARDEKNGAQLIGWWFFDGLPIGLFTALSCVLFAGWAVFAAWRCMAAELREPARWWAWPAFAAFVAFWLAGMHTAGPSGIAVKMSPGIALGVAGLILTAASYLGLLLSPLTQVSRNRYARANAANPAQGKRHAIEKRVPVWLIHGALALAVALVAVLLELNFGTVTTKDIPSTGIKWLLAPIGLSFGLPLALMALRDMAILSCFTLNTSIKRPVAMALFYLAVANFLVPTLLKALGMPMLARAVFPLLATDSGWWPTVGFAIHAALAAAALWFVAKRQRAEPA